MRRRHHHPNDRRNGAAINILVALNPDLSLDVHDGDIDDDGRLINLTGDERADALLRVAAAIDAELGPPLHPGTADRPVPDPADPLRPVVAALVRHALRSGDVAAYDKRVLDDFLQPACDWPDK